MGSFVDELHDCGAEQIIIDLPNSKTEGIRILARYPNGAIRVPEFSFNPQKWADAYDLQKRTGYVFCPREVAQIVGLASKIVFLKKFGVCMSAEADGYIKAKSADPNWIAALVEAGIIDDAAAERLTAQRFCLIPVRANDLRLPPHWLRDDVDLADRLSGQLQKALSGGLVVEHLASLGQVLEAMYGFVDSWLSGPRVTADLDDEAELQDMVREFLQARQLKVTEGSIVGGGELDLFVADSILIENKFRDRPADASRLAPAAGMQGRRYAIALQSQIVIVVMAYKVEPGRFPTRAQCVEVRQIARADKNRAEIRFSIPFGAVTPSHEKPEPLS